MVVYHAADSGPFCGASRLLCGPSLVSWSLRCVVLACVVLVARRGLCLGSVRWLGEEVGTVTLLGRCTGGVVAASGRRSSGRVGLVWSGVVEPVGGRLPRRGLWSLLRRKPTALWASRGFKVAALRRLRQRRVGGAPRNLPGSVHGFGEEVGTVTLLGRCAGGVVAASGRRSRGRVGLVWSAVVEPVGGRLPRRGLWSLLRRKPTALWASPGFLVAALRRLRLRSVGGAPRNQPRVGPGFGEEVGTVTLLGRCAGGVVGGLWWEVVWSSSLA